MTLSKQYIPVFKGIDLSNRRIPVIIADSLKPGLTVVLTAAIHGDEVTGIAVIQSLLKRLDRMPLKKGKIVALPILNPMGFETISRHIYYDGEDLNRHFNGQPDGSTAERLASIILTSILQYRPDFVIDLHTDSANSIAYSLVDKPDILADLLTFRKSMKLAQQLNFSWAIDTDASAGYPAQNCFTGQLVLRGTPAVTVELGGPLVVSDAFRKMALENIWRLLADFGMVDPMPNSQPSDVQNSLLTFQERIRTQSTGIIEYRVKPGENIHSGQILGIIRNVFGEAIEVIRSPGDGILFSHEDQSVVFPGLALFAIASPAHDLDLPTPLDIVDLPS